MQRLILIFIAVRSAFSNRETTDKENDHTVVSVAEEIGKRYFAGCSQLIFTDDDEEMESRVFKLGKRMMSSANRQGCAIVKSFEKYMNSLNKTKIQDRCSREMNILYGKDGRMKKLFTEV